MSTHTSVEIYKALADDVRLGLVRKLAQECQPKLTCDIIGSCTQLSGLSQPTMSHHIGKLVDAGVLIEYKQAKQKSYQLNIELLAAHGIDATKL